VIHRLGYPVATRRVSWRPVLPWLQRRARLSMLGFEVGTLGCAICWSHVYSKVVNSTGSKVRANPVPYFRKPKRQTRRSVGSLVHRAWYYSGVHGPCLCGVRTDVMLVPSQFPKIKLGFIQPSQTHGVVKIKALSLPTSTLSFPRVTDGFGGIGFF
jgi:hypothetical protein